jgi:hypothetical protein
MAQVVIRLVDERAEAQHILPALVEYGFRRDDISIITPQEQPASMS